MGRLSKEEAADRDLEKQSREAVKAALADLLAFVNLDPDTTDWRGWRDWTVHGDPAVQHDRSQASDPFWRLRELHGQVHAQMKAAVAGTFTMPVLVPISIRAAYTTSRGILFYPPQDELDEYLLWALLRALKAKKNFKQCQYPQCGTFYVGRTLESKHCSTACADVDRPDRRRRQTRAHQKSYRQRTSVQSVRRPHRPA